MKREEYMDKWHPGWRNDDSEPDIADQVEAGRVRAAFLFENFSDERMDERGEWLR